MLEGTFTAVVTPFKNGRVDYENYKILLKRQIEGGIDGIVPCGTTGESPTLSDDEFAKIIEVSVEECKGRIPVIAGCGTNSTEKTIVKTKIAKELGAQYALIVVPYYNKPTEEGIYKHFMKILECVNLPLIIYNIPSRTGVNMSVETIIRLSENPFIAGIKEASGNFSQFQEIINGCRQDFSLLSGDDGISLPIYSIGGKGVISVASNIVPSLMSEIYKNFKNGKWDLALKIHKKLYPLFKCLFIETNPIPVKTALSIMGLCSCEMRLPLCEAEERVKNKIKEVLKDLELM